MRTPVGWWQRLVGNDRYSLVQFLTPQASFARNGPARWALASATLFGLAAAATVALGAFMVLLAAIGAIYFLLTQVLGIELDIDPQAFMARAREYAAYGNAKN